MAKVYSWEVKRNPRTYAYIIHPDSVTYESDKAVSTSNPKAYIGAELKGAKLQKVVDWVQNAENNYEAQFQIMVNTCATDERAKNAVFDTVSSYIDLPGTCDLRGPAGRGIVNVTYSHSLNGESVYIIKYDDGTEDSFIVRDGKDGKDGIDGKPGAKGDAGISSKLIMIYTTGKDSNGELKTPERPEGGSYDFLTGKPTYPDGWAPNDNGITPPVWMSSRTFTTSELSTDPEWSIPVQITGENGAPGVDGVSTEFIYKRTKVKPTEVGELPSVNENGYVPTDWGWTPSPLGVTEDDPTEWCCIRRMIKNVGWGPWDGPTIWSQYGVNGQDGDGVQYIYMRNKGELPENPTPFGWDDPTSAYQDKDLEWVPEIGSYTNYVGNPINLTEEFYWSDNPNDVDASYQYQWVAVRKYKKGDDGKQSWQPFSNPSLWGKFGQDGNNGTSIRTLYALSTSTSNPPTVPTTVTETVDWGSGFPKDYEFGENVVWGITAEIWSHNNEFVNPEIGWSKPFLVTGVKGKDGDAINYNSRYFAYGWVNSTPYPPSSTDPNNIGTSLDGLGNIVVWRDYPDTKNVGSDNDERRWYQCDVHINGDNQQIEKYGPVLPCNGRDGSALPGKYTEFRFAVTPTEDEPILVQFNDEGLIIREPKLFNKDKSEQWGWFSSDKELPELKAGGAVWEIWATIDGAKEEVVIQSDGTGWSGPIRVSGERGEQGIQGPAGLRGITGIPGAMINPMYCLGTKGRQEIGESFFENGDGYFGSDLWKDNVLPEALTGWYKTPPYSDFLDATSTTEVSAYASLTNNIGRIIRYISVEENSGVTETYYTYYIIEALNTLKDIKKNVPKKDELDIYIWSIQGTDIWESGTVGEGEEGDTVKHERIGVDWSDPFRLQGTNGLRGLTGNKGQVVYPKGIYNQEEIYITTEDKAPYVYDPNDGLFYVYNITNKPWVGKLPSNYKTVKVDKNGNITEDGEFYKYSIDGTYGNWIGDQNGDTPSQNYANHTDEGSTPAWVRFESFEALYTSIGIIANGMVGSAVYNNEFMFSQQGIDRYGNKTNYAVVSGKDTSYGFLSGYKYDNDGDELGRHWYYKNTQQYINDSDVNPYERKNESNKNYIGSDVNDGEYIHTFMPNVCINFSTGQMWASCGKNHFDSDGTGYVADEAIKWWFSNGNVGLQIGRDGENGIKFEDSELTIGPLNSYKGEMDIALQNMNDQITSSTETLKQELSNYINDLQEQVDKRADTYYQSTDPSSGSVIGRQWQTSDSANTATYAPNRVGDLWYDTSVGKSYVYASSSNGVEGFKRAAYPTNAEYFWVESNVPESVYNAISTRSKIFVGEPDTPYYAGDLWFVHSNDYMDSAFYGNSTGISSGTCVVCLTTNTGDTFSTEHWGRRDRYADEAQLAAAQEELAIMTNRLRNWASDVLLSPTEIKLLDEEYQTIKNEYPTITGQAQTLKLTDTTEYTDYTNAYSKVVKISDEYYLNSANATATTNSFGAISTGGDCVAIVTGETETYWYGWYETYYTKRQLLLQAISNKLNSNISEGIVNAVTSANTYTDGQISGITNTITALSGTVQTQLDAKIDTWKTNTDPSKNWTSDVLCQAHLGDMWYDTSNGLTWSFINAHRPGMGPLIAKEAETVANALGTKYWWLRNDVSLLLFDYNDGKSSVFYNVNPTGYAQNDMWMVPSGQTEFGEYAVGDIVVCNRIPALSGTNDAGSVIATGFTAEDWVKITKYTDDSFAETKFKEWAQDGYLSPPERKALINEAGAIMSESGSTYSQACTYLGSTATTTINYVNAAKYAYNTAMYYYHEVDTGLTKSIKIADAVSTGDNKTYYANIQNYYKVRQATQNAIMNKINDNASGAANDTAFLKDVFGSITDNNGATLSKFLGVTTSGTSTNNVVAYMDGSGMVKNSAGTSKLVFASGIPTGPTALSTRATNAQTKIYDDGTFETKKGVFSGKIQADIAELGSGDFLIRDGIVSFYPNTTSNIAMFGGDSNGLGFTSTKNSIKYNYTFGDTKVDRGTITSYGFDGTTKSYNLSMPFQRGALFSMLNTSKSLSNYTFPTYTALNIVSDVGSSSYDSYAISCASGMHGGLRPSIITSSGSSYTADLIDHTIIMTKTLEKDKSGNSNHTIQVYIPRTPPKGQEYVIIHTGAAWASVADNRSHFIVSLTGTGTSTIKNVNQGGVDRGTSIEWRGVRLECRFYFDGTYWWVTYNDWEGAS